MTTFRRLTEADWPDVWAILEPVVRSGRYYPYALDMTSAQAHEKWIDATEAAYVAEDDAQGIVGTYYIAPNQPSLGAHVANCGYAVAENARGRGVATQMCMHSQEEAVRLGYRAMQFNLVVATNTASVNLWPKMGFEKVGRLPGAFKHKDLGFVDAYVMYKVLV